MAKIKIEPFIEGELAKYCQNLRNEPVYLVLKRLTSNLWWDKIALDLNWLSPDKQKIWILHLRNVIEVERNIEINVKQQIKNAAQRMKIEIAVLEVKPEGGDK